MPPMGKIARFALVLGQVVVSLLGIFVGADALPDLVTPEGGDEISRGHRAMAILGALFSGLTILVGAFAIDLCLHPFLDAMSLPAIILAALAAPFLIYFLLDRRITRLERARAETTAKTTPEA